MLLMKNTKTTAEFGQRLAKHRRAKGLTQQQLADILGVSRRVIAYYETETENPLTNLIVPLTKALNITTDELLGIKQPKETLNPQLSSLWRRLKVLETFPEKDRKAVLHYVNALAEKNNARQQKGAHPE